MLLRGEGGMGNLEDLFDKGTGGKCNKWRHYFEIYERYFSKFVGKKCTYVEIGVQRGGSLQIIKEYLGGEARVIGVDIDPAVASLRNEGKEIHIGDQGDPLFLSELAQTCGPFDIIVDDGSHIPDHQLTSFFSLFPNLNDGGIYIVEDLEHTFFYGFQDSRFGINFYDFAKGLVDKLSIYTVEQSLHGRYSTPRENRSGVVQINNFAANSIFGIHFYENMAVFEKRRRIEPLIERK